MGSHKSRVNGYGLWYQTKAEIAREQLRWACAAGLPRGVVVLDAGDGTHTGLRAEIAALGLSDAAGILSNSSVWHGTGGAEALVGPRAAAAACPPR